MRLRSIFFMLVVFYHTCYSQEDIESSLRLGESARLLEQVGGSDFRDNVFSQLSQDRDTRTLIYPLHQSLEQNVRDTLDILSNESSDDAHKIQELRALVTQAKPLLLREIQDQLNPAKLIAMLSDDITTAQEVSEYLKGRKETEENISRKVQDINMLKFISPLVAEDDAPSDLLDFPVFSRIYSDKIKK